MPAIERQPGLFDYAALTPTTRDIVQRRTGEIQDLMRRTAADIVDIGLKLIEVKVMLLHGNFGVWLESEFGWSSDTAQNFMRVARSFKNRNFRDLDIAPSALYALASPSSSEPLRQQIIERAEAGEHITHKTVKQAQQSAYRERLPAAMHHAAASPPHVAPAVDSEDFPPHDASTGEILDTAPDFDGPAMQTIIRPDEQHVITPKNDHQLQREAHGWPAANRLSSELSRANEALKALLSYSRERLAEIEDSPAGRELLISLSASFVLRSCEGFSVLLDAENKIIDAEREVN